MGYLTQAGASGSTGRERSYGRKVYMMKPKEHCFQEGLDKLRVAQVVVDVGRTIIEQLDSAVEAEKKSKNTKMYRSYLYGGRKDTR